MISKHLALSALLIALAVIIVAVIFDSPAYQNYQGICLEEGRVLTDEEKIRRAIEQINGQNTLMIEDQDGRIDVPRIRYSSTDDFLEKNHNCCHITSAQRGVSKDLFMRKSGYNSYVTVKYTAFYKGTLGAVLEKQIIEFNEVSNCGKLLWGAN